MIAIGMGQAKKFFSNQEIAQLLEAVAAAYEVKGGKTNRFKAMAYQRAAEAIEHLTSEAKDLWDEGKLNSIPGVGASIAHHLDELFRTGKVKHFEKVMAGLPQGMFALIKLDGIGPKTAFRLCQRLGIRKTKNAIARLRKAAEEGKIRQIPGFGPDSEKRILEAIKTWQRHKEQRRLLLPYAHHLATQIVNYLRSHPAILRVDPLGSLRRRCATVGDVDIAVASWKPKEVVKHFISYPKVAQVLDAGEKSASVILNSGHQVDLKVQKPTTYGALLQHFTGSKHHNIHLRELALKKGLSVSEHGIKDRKTGKLYQFATEEEFYRFLGMEWIPPEIREDNGEIEASLEGKLPKLIPYSAIKGDLHLHSNFPIESSHDDGISPAEEMVRMALELGYEYLGFSEHNPSLSQHTSKEIVEILVKKHKFMETLVKNCENLCGKRLVVLNGLEVDIRPDGSLALPLAGFDFLDYVIVSVHSSFKMNKKTMTKRILKALGAHPKVKILGHPTGRKINEREGFEADWETIFKFCKNKSKFLEINAWPDRLDLPDVLVRGAVKMGVGLIINTDAHEVSQMQLMEYGVAVARRGWAESKNILNTLSQKEFVKKILAN